MSKIYNKSFYQLTNFINEHADALKVLESLAGSVLTFELFFINGNSNILQIYVILVPCSISAFSLLDTIIRQSSFTRDTIAEFVNCVVLFEVLLIDCKITESIWK